MAEASHKKLRFLRDYGALLTNIGREAFTQRFNTPALVCQGVAGKLQSGRAGRNTELLCRGLDGPILSKEPKRLESLAGRVWLVRRDSSPDANHLEITVGRTVASDVVIPDHSLSREHAVFRLEGIGGLAIMDLGSSNGTHLRGQWLLPRKYEPVLDCDDLTFGRLCFDFLLPPTFLKRVLYELQTLAAESTKDDT